MPFQSILVCLDLISEESALIARACELAQHNDARITFLHVLPDEAIEQHSAPDELKSQVRRRVKLQTDAVAHGLTSEVRIEVGYPLSVILLQAAAHSLVMTGADHNRRVGDLLFGGTTTRLLRACPQPVLVVRSDHHQAGQVVLAAVALHANEGTHDALDRAILSHAAEQAALSSGTLHVVHVAQSWMPFEGVDQEMEAQSQAGLDAARAKLDKLLAATGTELPPEQVHLREGDPPRELARVTEKLAAELVVMGTVGRTGIAGLIVGNTAETMMKTLDSSLLALKPEGFVAGADMGTRAIDPPG